MPKIIYSHDFCQTMCLGDNYQQFCYLMKMKIEFEAYVSQKINIYAI